MGIKFSKSEAKALEEPFLRLGYGINAFFDLILSLIYMFVAITIFSIPMYYAFSKNAIDYFNSSPNNMFDRYTLGNLGGASVICLQANLAKASNFEMQCPHGTQMDMQKLTYGIINPNLVQINFCKEEAISKFVSANS